MATTDVLSVVMEARAAVAASHRLLEEMRLLRVEVTQNLTAVRRTAATLAINMSVSVVGNGLRDRSEEPVSPVILPASPSALDSHVSAPHVNVPAPPPSDSPGPRPLDLKDQMALDLLTPRELEVLRLIGEGQRTKEIAFTLGITFKTAVTHRSNIMEKLGIHEGPRLVRFAIRTGITTA